MQYGYWKVDNMKEDINRINVKIWVVDETRSSLRHLYPASRLRSFKFASSGRVTYLNVLLNSHVSYSLEDSPVARCYAEAQNVFLSIS